MFDTSLSPLVSQIAFGTKVSSAFTIVLGIIFGILIGFILPPLSAHMLRTHDGYNLYNIGFTLGIIETIIIALFRSYGFIIESKLILSTKYDKILKIYISIFFILLIILGYFFNNKNFKGYSKIFRYSGRLVTDFTQLIGFGLTLINMGIMYLISILYVILSKGIIDDPIIARLLTVVGFSPLVNTLKILYLYY